MRIALTVNAQEHDGFRVSVSTETTQEMEVAQEILKLLIAKITKIEVSVSNGGGYEN